MTREGKGRSPHLNIREPPHQKPVRPSGPAVRLSRGRFPRIPGVGFPSLSSATAPCRLNHTLPASILPNGHIPHPQPRIKFPTYFQYDLSCSIKNVHACNLGSRVLKGRLSGLSGLHLLQLRCTWVHFAGKQQQNILANMPDPNTPGLLKKMELRAEFTRCNSLMTAGRYCGLHSLGQTRMTGFKRLDWSSGRFLPLATVTLPLSIFVKT